MKITKVGHACILVEEGNARFLVDPGEYNVAPPMDNIDAILITHEHQDHMSVDMIKSVLEKNPHAQVITCAAAAKILDEKGIVSTIFEEGDRMEVKGVWLEAQGEKHALIYGDIPQCQNICFLIADKLFHPGDSFFVPNKPVEVLALPVAGPWMKLAECIDYAKTVKPKVVFPMHDGMMRPERAATSRMFPKMLLEPAGIEFRDMGDGATEEF